MAGSMRKRRDIVFKRILTVTLATILTLETPLTAYAAQTAPVRMEESVEGINKSAEDIAENDEITEGVTENPSEEKMPEKADGPEKDPEEPEQPEEGEIPDTGEAGSKNPGIGEDDSKNPDTGEEPSDDSKNPDTEEEPSDDSENPGIEDEISEGPVDHTQEEDIPPVEADEPEETEATVSENSVSDNTLPAAAFSVRASEETVTALSFEALSGDGVQVTLPAKTDGINHYVWYSFTAPEDGRYAFYTVEAFDAYFYLCAEPTKVLSYEMGRPRQGHHSIPARTI